MIKMILFIQCYALWLVEGVEWALQELLDSVARAK